MKTFGVHKIMKNLAFDNCDLMYFYWCDVLCNVCIFESDMIGTVPGEGVHAHRHDAEGDDDAVCYDVVFANSASLSW